MNGIVGGVLKSESFAASQCYYYGGANVPAKVILVEGDYIDDRPDLDEGAIGKTAGSVTKDPTKPDAKPDRSKALFALACQLHRAGNVFADFEAREPAR